MIDATNPRAGDLRTAWSATLIGLGNIGGFAAGLLARPRPMRRLLLLDRDCYEESNRFSQDISSADVGRPKAVVQAERVCRINPQLHVDALVDDVECTPLGRLRADLIVACLDSRRARQAVNQAAWRLGIPWVDAGVHTEGGLARVNVYLPAPGQPCYECAFDQRDYDLLEQEYPCAGDAPAPPATNAPAALGALAAALQVLECQKLLAGQFAAAAIAKQVLVDSSSHRQLVTSYRYNPACRFDHLTWSIEPLDVPATNLRIGDVFAGLVGNASEPRRAADAVALQVYGHAFVKQLTCVGCGTSRSTLWRLSGRLGAEQQCPRCARRMSAAGFDATDWLRERDLSPAALAEPLSTLGVQDGDVITRRGPGSEQHFQLGRARDGSLPCSPLVRTGEGQGGG